MKRAALVAGALVLAFAGGALLARPGSTTSRPAARTGGDHAGAELLASARASGTWTAAERDALRGLLRGMSAAERGEVLQGLAAAMNRGEIVLVGIKTPH